MRARRRISTVSLTLVLHQRNCAHQPSVRSSDPRMRQCRVITFSRGSRDRIDPGTAASDTAVNAFAHSVGAAVTVPVCGLQVGALRCATP